MRRDIRRKVRNNQNEDMGNKIIKYATIAVIILTIIVIGLLVYSQSMTEEIKEGTLSSDQLASLVNRTNENIQSDEGTESTATEMGKTVEEVQNELDNTVNTVTENTTNNSTNSVSEKNTLNTNTNTNANTTNTNKTQNTLTTSATENNKKAEEETKQEAVQELKFIKPVEGEVVKEYSKENLIFSETLQEWTVHTGVDIKADKTTVVKAAEAGTVKSIKNDPRYGLTIVIEHQNGFQTVYANLLTSEFVVEGEKVEKEQSLGTVGNTAAFESAEESHLHFEILKDNIQVDPNIYLK